MQLPAGNGKQTKREKRGKGRGAREQSVKSKREQETAGGKEEEEEEKEQAGQAERDERQGKGREENDGIGEMLRRVHFVERARKRTWRMRQRLRRAQSEGGERRGKEGGREGDGKKRLEMDEDRERVNARRGETRREERKRQEGKERERGKEMQRLPYNGAPRAHKLRHNVISSSLFNERWQRALRTRFYPGVFVVRVARRICLSLSHSLSPDAFLVALLSPLHTTAVLPENLLRAARVALSSRFQT